MSSLLLLFVCCIVFAVAWWVTFSKVRARLRFVQGTPIASIVLRCTTLQQPWRPIPWLPGGFLQTLAVAKLRPRPAADFSRELFALSDGGQVGLDWLTPAPESESAPILIVLHGLNGGSSENYVRGFIRRARSELGCRCVVLVARGLGGVPLKTWRPYNAGWTEDLREVVAEVAKRFPRSKIVATGFSLGANVLARYVSEEGEKCPLAAAAVVSSPLDLAESTRYLENSGRTGRMFSAQMAAGLIRFTKKNVEMLSSAPSKPDIEAVMRARLCREYDEAATCKLFGFPNATAYYNFYSSLPMISGIKRPTLILGSTDDPMTGAALIERAAAEAEKTGHVVVAISPAGGHLGFLEVAPGKLIPTLFRATESWADRACSDFFHAVLDS